jgi:hypothetical protein
MAKPKTAKSPDLAVHAFRAPPEVLDALDRWVDALNASTRARWSRNAIILAVVERALKERADSGDSP